MATKLTARRELQIPYFWVVRDADGKKIDRDQYSNDLRERYKSPEFEIVFHKDGSWEE